MKLLRLSLILTALLSMCCCTNSHRQGEGEYVLQEGAYNDMGDMSLQQYYILCSGDTTAIACEVCRIPSKNMMNIAFRNILPDSDIVSDSLPVSYNDTQKKYKPLSYNQQKEAVKAVFLCLSEKPGFNELKNISFPILSSGALNVELTEALSQHKDLREAVRQSSFYAYMRELLADYHLTIDNVYIEKYCYVPPAAFYAHNIKDSIGRTTMPNHFLDGEIGLSVKSLP